MGYGDITPENDVERIYVLVTELFACMVFGYMLSTVSKLVESVDPNAVKIQEKFDQIKVYLRWHDFPPELSMRVRRYYEFYYSRKSAMDEDEIVGGLAPTLRRDVQTHLMAQNVMKIPLFSSERSYTTLSLQLEIHNKLRPMLREARERITEALEKGAVGGPSVFFLRRGQVAATASIKGVSFFEIDAGSRAVRDAMSNNSFVPASVIGLTRSSAPLLIFFCMRRAAEQSWESILSSAASASRPTGRQLAPSYSRWPWRTCTTLFPLC